MINVDHIETLSTSLRKLVQSLSSAKGRRETGLFFTERTKNVLDLLGSRFTLRYLIARHAWFEEHKDLDVYTSLCRKATTADMERITSLSTPADVIAVFEIPQNSQPSPLSSKLTLALDAVQDPGNLGTIIRLADWFGIDTIYAGHGTVDPYNPKCVISSMGSVARVHIVSTDLKELLSEAGQKDIPCWGTFLDGENIYDLGPTASGGIIVMGNEGNGISAEVAAVIPNRISIPPYPADRKGAESLNVAMATAITLSEFRRRASNKTLYGKD